MEIRFGTKDLGEVQDFAYSALELTGGDFVLAGGSRSFTVGDQSETVMVAMKMFG